MKITTIVSKRSVREIEKDRRFRKFYSLKEYAPGDAIEIIDGGKKTPALILKQESAEPYKQAIRDGSLTVEKLPLSKTGDHAQGVVLHTHSMDEIRTYLKDSAKAQSSTDDFLKSFFPKKRTPAARAKQHKATKDGTLSTLSMDRYTQSTRTHSTELQLFVDEVRTHFKETARYGQGSFSYYLGMCKKIPMQDLWQMYGEAKQARGKTRFEQKKLFWWKLGQYLKDRQSSS